MIDSTLSRTSKQRCFRKYSTSDRSCPLKLSGRSTCCCPERHWRHCLRIYSIDGVFCNERQNTYSKSFFIYSAAFTASVVLPIPPMPRRAITWLPLITYPLLQLEQFIVSSIEVPSERGLT